ncbi:MAG: PKD domain-containing protein [Bacteroidota bacterium]|nr:PKD domain-containing protein [Bacteroidota bacterium]MDX5431290.1 PKD domain-containing protein [Bacteroidota bacterium]MDX5470028.1 PKD domain-containing protein [Bacteroidota bacterium]
MRFFAKNQKIYGMVLVLGAAYVTLASALSSNNPPSAMTNAPNESNCTSCHSGSLNPTPANLANLTLTGAFTGGGYLPDSTYTLTLSYAQSGINKFGFEITALRTDNDAPAGTFTAGTGSLKATQSVNGATREYLKQSSAGTSGSGSRSWTFTWQAPSTNVDTITFYAVVNAANGNNNTSGDQIYAKEFKIAPSDLLPTAIIQTSKSLVCAGDTMTLYGSGTNSPTSYKWKFQVGFPQIVTTQNVVRTYNNVGTFSDTLWVTNAKGISAPTRVLTQVVAKPAANITSVTPNDTVCAGDSIVLTSNTGTGLSYSWDTGNPADTFSSVVIKQSGSYKVTVTNANGCSRESSPINLTFQTKPNPFINTFPSLNTICQGDTFRFLLDGATFVQCDFYDGNTLVQSGSQNYYEVRTPGTYNISAVIFDGFCTTSTPPISAKTIAPRLAAPIIQCGQATTDEVNFHWNPVNGAISYEYRINNGNFVALNDTFLKVSGLNFNTQVSLEVRAVSGAFCSYGYMGSASCTSLPCSQFTYALFVSDSIVCEGDTVHLELRNLSLSNYSTSINGIQTGDDTLFSYVPSAINPRFEIAILDSMSPGCPAFVILDSVEVKTAPNLQVTLSDTSYCMHDGLTFQCSPGFRLYQVVSDTRGGVIAFPQDSFTVFILESGERVRVRATTDYCTVDSDPVTVTVFMPRIAGFEVSGSNRSWTFTDTTTLTRSRIWDFGDASATDTARVTTHVYQNNGSFDVIMYLTDLNGCMDTTGVTILSDNVGLNPFSALDITLYPNPNTGQVTITSDEPIQRLAIYSMEGKQLRFEEFESTTDYTFKHQLSPGTYLIQVQGLNDIAWMKMLVE